MSPTWVSAIAASGALLLGVFVAVAFTRIQTRSAKRSADAAEAGAARASEPRLKLSVNDESDELVIVSDGPDEYAHVELVSVTSVDSAYRTPILVIVDEQTLATSGDLGRFVPHHQKALRYVRVIDDAGGKVNLIFRCVTVAGREYPAYAPVDVPGTPISTSTSVPSTVSGRRINGSGEYGTDSYAVNPAELLKSLNWSVQRLCACCFTERSKNLLADDAQRCLDVTYQLTGRQSFKRLAQGVADFISELIPGKRRFALYRGNQDVLVPFYDSGWQDCDPPLLKSETSALQSETSSNQSVICPKELFTALRSGRRFYVPDVDNPPGSDYRVVTVIPGAQQFKSLAIVPVRAFPSFAEAEQENECLLLGAILVQHTKTDVLHDERDRHVLSLLGSLLATALVHLAAREDNGSK